MNPVCEPNEQPVARGRGLEIKPGEVREGNADRELKLRVRSAYYEPDRGARNDWGLI